VPVSIAAMVTPAPTASARQPPSICAGELPGP
jgi:hypothetical protein